MPTFEVTCPTDGKVRVWPEMIWLDLDAEACCYTCPQCGQGNYKPVSELMIEVLKSNGVEDIDTIVERESATIERIG